MQVYLNPFLTSARTPPDIVPQGKDQFNGKSVLREKGQAGELRDFDSF